ncbi:MAG: hypothetical protein GKR87_01690 [Kiritimatiellae bacterium]|nr:hypothetical protein [Kiritimatiellia bacterium]
MVFVYFAIELSGGLSYKLPILMETLIPLASWDWAIIAIFFVVTLGIGLYFSRRAANSLTEYFVAGRKMTWWIAGTSIVATSFAADTPLVIAGWMRTIGLERNWFWWGGIMGMMLCTFFFARLWRRSRILTDVEFNELRYGGAPAAGLRIFHASYRALIQNTLIMCWVTLAMSKILEVTLNIPPIVIGEMVIPAKVTGIIICLTVASLYSALSGLWGVMYTDLFQFCLAMTGTIILMFIVFAVADGPKNLIAKAHEAVTQGLVINKAPQDRMEVKYNENLEKAGLIHKREDDSWTWIRHDLTEEQFIFHLQKVGVETPDKEVSIWKDAFTLRKTKFTDFKEVDKIVSAGILVADTVDGQPPEYYRIANITLSESVINEQLDQAGVKNKGEILAALRNDRVVPFPKITSFLPPFDLKGGGLLAIWSLVVFLGLQWWAGGEGGGFLAQRLFSCKNEKHSVMAMLWFNFANFVLRPWPWIVVGVGSLFLIPDITAYGAHYDAEYAYAVMLMKYLPVGLKGLMVASLMAAYMSTISTHVNFGASYVVNDLYSRFINPKATDRNKVGVSQITSILLAALAGVAAYYATDIGGLWLTMFELMSGAGFVVLLRWYWWRISAWSELSAMFSTLFMWFLMNKTHVFHAVFGFMGWPIYLLDEYAVRFTLNILLTTLIWVIITFLTPPEKEGTLVAFYKRICPGGWWNHIAVKAGNPGHLIVGKMEWTCWFLGVTGLFAMIACVGKLCFGLYLHSVLFGLYSIIVTWLLFRLLGKMDWSTIENRTNRFSLKSKVQRSKGNGFLFWTESEVE